MHNQRSQLIGRSAPKRCFETLAAHNMNEPIQYEKVKVKILLREPSEYNSWNLNRRMPQVGDVGYFIELLHTKGCPDHYVVEKTDPQTGENIWMSEFERNEIEPIK